MDFYVKPEFTEGIYDSCKDVSVPSGDLKAVQTMCGKAGEYCNAERWFIYMGQEAPTGFAPFTITYKYLNETTDIDGTAITPFADTILPCDQAVSLEVLDA